MLGHSQTPNTFALPAKEVKKNPASPDTAIGLGTEEFMVRWKSNYANESMPISAN
jgi:hypothetical protein